MAQVADHTAEQTSSGPFAFGAHLLRPWLVANFVAFSISGAIGGTVLRSLLQPAIELAATRMEVARIGGLSTAAASLTLGLALGLGQWLVLRRAIRASWWAPATCAGWILVGFLVGFNSGGASWETRPEAGPITPFLPAVVTLPVIVVLLSAGQWLVLRRDCAGAYWWPLVTMGALFVAFFAGFVVAMSMPFLAPTDFPSGKALVIVGAVAGPIYGYFTWLYLAQLRRRATS